MPRIRKLAGADWELLKSVRLEMLADTPMAYIESLASARRQTDSQWQERASAMSAADSVTWVADEGTAGSKLRALMRVVIKHPQTPDRPLQAMLISVYVAPEYRGVGLADRLLQRSVVSATEDLSAGILELGVHQDNARALAFYRRHGFHLTGASKPYPQDRSKLELTMERVLPRQGGSGDGLNEALEKAGTD
ncbi:GNAT family N-acetyltransferase [Paenarthrobacter sp. NPDC089675]|uniref:GNAT family N-acetyltransferase n=1 Tax=Paenarthrobacter sp. NPDC089675 TaxID=3364376 RepID=UPI003818E5F9